MYNISNLSKEKMMAREVVPIQTFFKQIVLPFFTFTSPRYGRKNTKMEKSVPRRVPFLENLGKKVGYFMKIGEFQSHSGSLFSQK